MGKLFEVIPYDKNAYIIESDNFYVAENYDKYGDVIGNSPMTICSKTNMTREPFIFQNCKDTAEFNCKAYNEILFEVGEKNICKY